MYQSNTHPMVGEEVVTRSGLATVVQYTNARKLIVKFEETGTEVETNLTNFKKGSIKDPYHKSVYGVGYLGIGKYSSKDKKAYRTWVDMIKRCYSHEHLKRRPTYQRVTVCNEWHNFQVFAMWFEETYIEGMQLDKDSDPNSFHKEYSPNSCEWISAKENSSKSTGKEWRIRNPNGEEILITNLKQYSEEHNLDSSAMYKVATGQKKSHKGYTTAR